MGDRKQKSKGSSPATRVHPDSSDLSSVDLTNPLFLYGSLMAPEILSSVLVGNTSQSSDSADFQLPIYQPATLANYTRLAVKGATFPAIIPAEDESVKGCVIYLENIEQLESLDAFENGLYTRELVELFVGEEKRPRKGYVYVWAGKRNELKNEPWDYDSWVKKHMPRWMSGGPKKT